MNEKSNRNLRAEMEKQGISGNRLAMMAYIASPSFYNAINGKIPWYRGWRERIAKALGVPESEIFVSEEFETEGHHRAVQVVQLSKEGELLHVWKSINEAAKNTGVCRVSIRNCCIGRQKSAGGFKWEKLISEH